MESIDALANAINEFEGGMVLVSHDMRLISQVAKEIWICDHKCVTKYHGDIQNFKMEMRSHMGISNEQKTKNLRGDASVIKKSASSVSVDGKNDVNKAPGSTKAKSTDMGGISLPISSSKPSVHKSSSSSSLKQTSVHAPSSSWDNNDEDTEATSTTASSFEMDGLKKNMPSMSQPASDGTWGRGSYIPPHLRSKK
jgi:Ulp1 family protease